MKWTFLYIFIYHTQCWCFHGTVQTKWNEQVDYLCQAGHFNCHWQSFFIIHILQTQDRNFKGVVYLPISITYAWQCSTLPIAGCVANTYQPGLNALIFVTGRVNGTPEKSPHRIPHSYSLMTSVHYSFGQLIVIPNAIYLLTVIRRWQLSYATT